MLLELSDPLELPVDPVPLVVVELPFVDDVPELEPAPVAPDVPELVVDPPPAEPFVPLSELPLVF